MKVKTYLRTDNDDKFILLSDSDIDKMFKEIEDRLENIQREEEKKMDKAEVEKQLELMKQEGWIEDYERDKDSKKEED